MKWTIVRFRELEPGDLFEIPLEVVRNVAGHPKQYRRGKGRIIFDEHGAEWHFPKSEDHREVFRAVVEKDGAR